MLLYIPSIVVTAVLVLFAIYAMWTRGIDLTPMARSAPEPRAIPQPEVLAA